VVDDLPENDAVTGHPGGTGVGGCSGPLRPPEAIKQGASSYEFAVICSDISICPSWRFENAVLPPAAAVLAPRDYLRTAHRGNESTPRRAGYDELGAVEYRAGVA